MNTYKRSLKVLNWATEIVKHSIELIYKLRLSEQFITQPKTGVEGSDWKQPFTTDISENQQRLLLYIFSIGTECYMEYLHVSNFRIFLASKPDLNPSRTIDFRTKLPAYLLDYQWYNFESHCNCWKWQGLSHKRSQWD